MNDLRPLPSMASPAPELRQTISVRSLLAVLRQHAWYFVLPCLALIGAFTAAAFLITPRYRAQALLGVENAEPSEDTTVVMLDAQQLSRFTEALHQRTLLEQLSGEFGLGPASPGRLPEPALAALRQRIRTRAEGPRTFSLAVEDTQAQRAAAIAQRLAELLVAGTRNERQARAQGAVDAAQEQLSALRARMAEQERAIEAYKQEHFDELPEQAQNLATLLKGTQDGLHATTASLSELEAQYAALLSERAELERQGYGRDPLELHREELRAKLQALRRQYTPAHPDVIRAEAELRTLDDSIAGGAPIPAVADPSPLRLRYLQTESELEAVSQRLSRARSERQALRGESGAYQQRMAAAPRHEMVLAGMNREYEASKLQHQTLTDELHQAQLMARLENQGAQGSLAVVEAAAVPGRPFAPNRFRIILMGVVAGLGLGIAGAFLAHQGDTSFRDQEDFEAAANLPVLAAIPTQAAHYQRRAQREGGAGARWVSVRDEPNGAVAEQYRILAAKLISRGGSPRPTSVLVTSAGPQEGKTFTAVNMALALAGMVQDPVLLVDADLGRASVHRTLQMPVGAGLAKLLTHPDDDPQRYVRAHRGLHVMAAGELASDSRGTLASSAAQRVFHRLRQQFPYVIVDAPPVLAVADGLILQQVVDSILLVVRARATPRKLVRRALDNLDMSRLAGVVLNDVDVSEYSAYYGYYPTKPTAAAGGERRW